MIPSSPKAKMLEMEKDKSIKGNAIKNLNSYTNIITKAIKVNLNTAPITDLNISMGLTIV